MSCDEKQKLTESCHKTENDKIQIVEYLLSAYNHDDLIGAYTRNDQDALKRSVDTFLDRKYSHNARIFHAIEFADEKEVESLIKDSNTDLKWTNEFYEGWSFIHQAAHCANVRILDILVKSGADSNIQDCDGRTPLFYCESSEVMQLLLDNGAQVDHTDIDGDTPLHVAVISHNEDVLNILLCHGSSLTSWNNRGKTALDVAKEYKRSICIKVLKDAMMNQRECMRDEINKRVLQLQKFKSTIKEQKKMLEKHDLEQKELESKLEEQKKMSEQHDLEKKELESKLEEQKRMFEQHDLEKKELESKLEEQKKMLEQHDLEQKELDSKLEEQKKMLEQHDLEQKELESKLEEQKRMCDLEKKELESKSEEEQKRMLEQHDLEKKELESKFEEQRMLENLQHDLEKKTLESKLEEQKKMLEQHDLEQKELESKLEEQKRMCDLEEKELESKLEEQKKILEQKLLSQHEESETLKKRLSINNLCEVLKATADVQVKCEELGIALGLDRTVLSTISQNNLSIVQRHYEILKYWIKNGEASWKKLLFALRSPLLEEKEVAQEIVKKHLDNEGMSDWAIHIHTVTQEDKPLTETDLSDVLKITCTLHTESWKIIGLLIGMSDDVLEKIQKSHSSSEKCYHSMLEYWIGSGQAYWSILVDTLRGPLLRENEVSEEISKTYLKTTSVTIDQPTTTEKTPQGIFHVGKDNLEKMKRRLRNLYKENQEAQGIIFVIGIYGPAGTNVDVENISSTFNGLEFAVWRERDLTCADIACLAKVAASEKFPNYKYIAFYFAGHGGIDEHERSFILPMKEKDGEERFFVEENMLSNFKNVNKRYLFFFDCCLSSSSTVTIESTPVTQSLPPKKVFKLRAPVKCLVAYATSTGYKSQGDKISGGLWTRTLCEKLKEQLSLSDILDQTHDIVYNKVEGKQPPHYESCVGAVYLKGISEKTTREYKQSVVQSMLQDESGQIKGKCTEDQDEMDSRLRIESHSQIEERLQQLIQETRLTKQEQLEQLTSMKHNQLQQARSMDLIKQDQIEIKRDIKLEVTIPIMIMFVFIFSYLTKH